MYRKPEPHLRPKALDESVPWAQVLQQHYKPGFDTLNPPWAIHSPQMGRPNGKHLSTWRDEENMTALHYAVAYEMTESVRELLAAGASVSAEDALGLTPLHLAHIVNNSEILCILANTINMIDGAQQQPASSKWLCIPQHFDYILKHQLMIPEDDNVQSIQMFDRATGCVEMISVAALEQLCGITFCPFHRVCSEYLAYMLTHDSVELSPECRKHSGLYAQVLCGRSLLLRQRAEGPLLMTLHEI